MTDSLTTLIGKVQTLLLDDGTRYTTATVTAAARQALKEFNLSAPVLAGTLVTVVNGQHEYELYGGDFASIINVLSVHLQDSTGDADIELEYDAYFEDNRAYIRLREARSSGNLIVRYSQPNTINGLDSETLSSIPAYFDQVICDGAAYYSITIRSCGRVESVNLSADVPDNLRESAAAFRLAFLVGCADAGRRRARPSKLDSTWKYAPTGY